MTEQSSQPVFNVVIVFSRVKWTKLHQILRRHRAIICALDMCSICQKKQWGSNAKGARIEAPKAPRGQGYGLVINPDKSEAVLFSTALQTVSTSIALSVVDVAGAVIPLTANIKILVVVFDRHLNFMTHVQNVCKSVNYHIRAL